MPSTLYNARPPAFDFWGYQQSDPSGRDLGRVLRRRKLLVPSHQPSPEDPCPLISDTISTSASLGRFVSVRVPNRVLLLEGQHTMYMPTPSLGVDRVAHLILRERPNATVMSAIVSYTKAGGNFKVDEVRVDQLDENGSTQVRSYKSLSELIREFDPALIGIGGTSKDNPVTSRLLNESGAPLSSVLVVAGGIHVTRAPIETMRALGGKPIDIALIGTTEESLPKLLAAMEESSQSGDTRAILNIPESVTFVREPGYELLLDRRNITLPRFQARTSSLVVGKANVPVRSHYTIEGELPDSSQQRLTQWGDTTIVRLQTAEGCQYGCNFCAVKAIAKAEPWLPYDLFAIDRFLSSIERDSRIQGVSSDKLLVYLEDGQIGGSPGSLWDQRARALLKILEKYPYRYGIQVRYDVLNNSFLDALSEANVTYLFTSIESLNPTVLRRMNKGQAGDPVAVYAAYEKIRRRGIDYMISFIGGTEAEPYMSVPTTAAFIPLLSPAHIAFEIAKVYPGTADAEHYSRQHGINVASAYSSLRHLTDYSEELPPEERGCVLQHLNPKQAKKLHRLVDEIIIGEPGKLRSEWESRFSPLGPTKYEVYQPGFFSRK